MIDFEDFYEEIIPFLDKKCSHAKEQFNDEGFTTVERRYWLGSLRAYEDIKYHLIEKYGPNDPFEYEEE